MAPTGWIGQTIGGRYRIEALLGQGGMSSVYQGSDPNLRRTVAVKLIHPHLSNDPEFVRRFEEEAAAVAQLRHPNIVQVFDFDHEDEVYYMVLEYVPGETLETRLKRLNAGARRLPPAEVVKIAVEVAEAVEYAHRRGMIHRDIKPANVMLNVQGQAILMDFGVARMLGGKQHTATGAVIGTALYMSPEQVRGERPDHRADIYSLGVMLFEMASGRPPFEADSAMTVMMMHLNDPVPDLHQLNAEVPPELRAVIERALAKSPGERYQSAAEMANALRGVLARLQGAAPTGATMIERPVMGTAPVGATVIETPLAPTLQKMGVTETPPGAPKRGLALGLQIALGLVGLAGLILVIALGVLVFRPSAAGNGATAVAGASPIAGIPAASDTSVDATSPTVPPSPTATQIPVPPGMVLAPAGTFNMGSPAGAADEAPLHTVSLSAFHIDRREITNALYQLCVDAGACTPPVSTGSFNRFSYFDNTAFANYPVIFVTWDQADAFCAWQKKRLPTEAEWEYVASGGDGRRYPWGDEFNPAFLPATEPDTTAVGSFEQGDSPFGIADMAGNVLEWVADWYQSDYYSQSEGAQNPTGPASGDRKVARGGAFGNPDGSFYATTRRYQFAPDSHQVDLGFRCASSLPAP